MTSAIKRSRNDFNKTSRGTPLAILLSLGLAVSTVAEAAPQRADYQNNASREETTGFFGGALLGGLAGGPPGALLGAALGALTGDGLRARSEVSALRTDLYAAQLEAELAQQQSQQYERDYQLAIAELDRLRRSGTRTQPVYFPGDLSGDEAGQSLHEGIAGSGLSVHFRTGSSEIESQYQTQLDALARLALSAPGAALEISGYADRNGDSAANRRLSRQRAVSIANYLQERGVDSGMITTLSHGEAKPAHSTQSLETDFFDRRVSVTLRGVDQPMLTHSSDLD